nr:tryptophan synthase subunit beta [Lacticaseibacillus zhaodongensis]
MDTKTKAQYTPEDSMKSGSYMEYGGQYLPEILLPEIQRVAKAYKQYKDDPEFLNEFHTLLRDYANRPSLLYYAKNMTEDLGGAKIYLKREDLNHTGAHKINNVIGQALIAKRMGKTRLIAETGAGQHGVATATIAALFGMKCEIFMGKMDTDRQRLNVFRMELLGAKVHPVTSGTAVLKDAINAALQDYAAHSEDTFYVIGSAVGPHPYPAMVHDFQSVISKESKEQIKKVEGRLPDYVVACVGGGSNAIGSFAEYIENPEVNLIGAEAAGHGVNTPDTAATMQRGTTGIFHGMKSRFLQNDDGQINPVYSISAGLDYPGVGPEHVALMDSGRAQYVAITDDEAVNAFEYIAKEEGIVAAIESCHAVAEVMKLAPTLSKDKIIICTLSGRGDKDVASIAKYRGIELNED